MSSEAEPLPTSMHMLAHGSNEGIPQKPQSSKTASHKTCIFPLRAATEGKTPQVEGTRNERSCYAGSMGKGERNIIVLATLGMAFWWPMLRNSIVGFVFSPTAIGEAQSQFELWLFLGASAVLALLLAFVPKASRMTSSTWAVLAPCLAASALNLTLSALPEAPHEALLAADAIALACSYVVLPVAWASLLTTQLSGSHKRMLLVIAASYAASFLIGYLSYAPAPLNLIRPIGAPALSGIAWYLCARQRGRQPRSAGARFARTSDGGRSLYVLVLVLFLVSSVATGFINSGTASYVPTANTFIRDTLNVGVTASIIVIIGLSKHLERIKFSLIVVLSILLFGGIFLATLFQQSWFTAGTGLMQTSKSCFSLLLFMLVLIESMGKPHASGTRSMLLKFVIPTTVSSFISYLVVPLLAQAFGVSYSDFWGVLSLLMGFLLGVFLFSFLSSLVIKYLPRMELAPEEMAGTEGVARAMQQTYGLTEKETEVLALLLEGNTYKKIASLLYVSDSTVQSHAKSIYRKAGVHTKQELVDRAASMRESLAP